MAINESLRMKIEAELRLGKKPKELSDKYDVPYVTINGWSKKIQKEMANEDIDKLLDVDRVTLHHVADEVAKQAENPEMPEVKKINKLISQVDGLKRLEEKTRELSFTILKQVEVYMTFKPELDMRDLKDAATIVTTIHNSMFNKANTQINVLNNNNISTEKRDIFKSSLKA